MIRKFLTAAVLALTGLGLVQAAGADPLARSVFGAVPGPTGGAPVSIGFYSKGCVSGAVQLPESGPTWQAMRLSRNRNWGHPELVGFLIGLSQAARQVGQQAAAGADPGRDRAGAGRLGHRARGGVYLEQGSAGAGAERGMRKAGHRARDPASRLYLRPL